MLYICDADGPSNPTLDFIDDPYGKPSPNNGLRPILLSVNASIDLFTST